MGLRYLNLTSLLLLLQTASSGNLTISTLSFVPKHTDGGRTLGCRAQSPVAPADPLTDHWQLDVYCEYWGTVWVMGIVRN